MCGYADNHAKDTYRVIKYDTRKVMETGNIVWAEWEPSKPGDGIHIEVEPYEETGEASDEDEDFFQQFYQHGRESLEEDDGDDQYNTIKQPLIEFDWSGDDDEAGRNVLGLSVQSEEEEEEEFQEEPQQETPQNQNPSHASPPSAKTRSQS